MPDGAAGATMRHAAFLDPARLHARAPFGDLGTSTAQRCACACARKAPDHLRWTRVHPGLRSGGRHHAAPIRRATHTRPLRGPSRRRRRIHCGGRPGRVLAACASCPADRQRARAWTLLAVFRRTGATGAAHARAVVNGQQLLESWRLGGTVPVTLVGVDFALWFVETPDRIKTGASNVPLALFNNAGQSARWD